MQSHETEESLYLDNLLDVSSLKLGRLTPMKRQLKASAEIEEFNPLLTSPYLPMHIRKSLPKVGLKNVVLTNESGSCDACVHNI